MYAITGITGKVGGAVARALLAVRRSSDRCCPTSALTWLSSKIT
jgi:nucleoside-diphosphate-sugar epimerase